MSGQPSAIWSRPTEASLLVAQEMALVTARSPPPRANGMMELIHTLKSRQRVGLAMDEVIYSPRTKGRAGRGQ